MRLICCHIENFGKLHQVDFDFSSNYTVFLQENGWGKSTLASFIKVMLYGFDNERSRDEYQNERKRFAPWQGGIYGGSLTFSANQKEYVVTRTFGRKEKEDVFSLRDRITNLESRDYSSNLGEELFQIDSASFLRTVFFSQNDCETRGTDRTSAKIGNLAENTDDINNYEKADGKLNDILNAMSPSRKTGSLYKRKEDIAACEMDVSRGKRIEEAMEQLLIENRQLKKEYKKRKMQQIYGGLLEQYRLCKKEKETLHSLYHERMASQNHRGDSFGDAQKKTFFFVQILLAVLFFTVGVLLYEKITIMGLICIGIGVLLIVFLGKKNHARLVRFLKFHGFREEADDEEQSMELLHQAEQLEKVDRAFQKACEAIDQFEASEEVDDIESLILPDDYDLRQMIESLEQISSQMHRNEQKLLELQQKKADIEAKEAQLLEWKEVYEKELEKYRLLQKTRDHLREAKASFSARYRNPLEKAFGKYYEMLTGQKAQQYSMDANMELTAYEQGMQRENRFFSAGYRDLTGICMRMALVDAMYEKEKPFLVLDDPFVNLDEKKTEAGLKLLQNIAKEYQVIYFTCHESRK